MVACSGDILMVSWVGLIDRDVCKSLVYLSIIKISSLISYIDNKSTYFRLNYYFRL